MPVSRDNIPVCRVYKAHPEAIVPTVATASDIGYDITVVALHKQLGERTFLFDTGLKVHLQDGYYLEVVPRSSLSKSGFMLSNSVGIIDPGYRGNVYVALTKVDPSIPDPPLPWKCCQFIVRPHVPMAIQEMTHDFVDHTERGDGGFGSTDGPKDRYLQTDLRSYLVNTN